jgi:16S rRNA (adenine(1408)-N(1))-methyltransferase
VEIIRGKQASFISTAELTAQLSGYARILIDIGTGDGRFVQHVASARPDCFIIGIDTCRENLCDVSRRAPANALFVIANAQALPVELNRLADHVTVNFPWGSLLTGLLTPESAVMAHLGAITRPGASLETRLNAGALAEAGWSLDEGLAQVRAALSNCGFTAGVHTRLAAGELKAYPTTWAKRLAFGRDPRAVCLYGVRQGVIRPAARAEIPTGESAPAAKRAAAPCLG